MNPSSTTLPTTADTYRNRAKTVLHRGLEKGKTEAEWNDSILVKKFATKNRHSFSVSYYSIRTSPPLWL
ncbi:hypothetical protein [Pseudomonas sp. TUM22785]|uniref:hypothetical protein n=1 Tax=Pseudomonas sp. TUM22785 TaxID=3019098 RepID=UPI002306A1AC|nr:hypothetical protein [Pseudomonas sp. TUM22785]WCD82087.1 hypothetical protein PI990_08740 [Pseudomonas sp. TUM22785]